MKKLKTFVEISKKMEALTENAKGQLKGGFVVLSSSKSSNAGLDDLNISCPTNQNCPCNPPKPGVNSDCTNEGKTCSGTISG